MSLDYRLTTASVGTRARATASATTGARTTATPGASGQAIATATARASAAASPRIRTPRLEPRPLRIARIIAVMEPGGAQLAALRLLTALRRHGIDSPRLLVGEATPAGLALAAQWGLEVDCFGVAGGLQWRPAREFADWLAPRLAGADLVHAHMFGAWWAAATAAPAGVPVVASEHNEMTWPAGDFTGAARGVARRVDAFFAHGPAAYDFAAGLGLRSGVLRAGRSAVSGLDAQPLSGLATPRITFTGRFRGDKAPDVLLRAVAQLPDPPVTYLVGDGPDRAELLVLARRLGIADRVLMPGWSADPARYVAGATVHVVPSREEAWSQSAVVALGLRVPVVGTAVDGLARTLGEGRGVLVPPEDPAALAEAIGRVLAGDAPDPEPGIKYARRFTPARMSRFYLPTYRALVDARISRGAVRS